MTAPTPPPATGEASDVVRIVPAGIYAGARLARVELFDGDAWTTAAKTESIVEAEARAAWLRKAFAAARTAARAEAIRECASLVRDHAADLKRAGYPYGSLLALDVVTSFESLLAEPARAKGEGGK